MCPINAIFQKTGLNILFNLTLHRHSFPELLFNGWHYYFSLKETYLIAFLCIRPIGWAGGGSLRDKTQFSLFVFFLIDLCILTDRWHYTALAYRCTGKKIESLIWGKLIVFKNCLSLCWPQPWVLQKRMNWSRCCLGCRLRCRETADTSERCCWWVSNC